MVITQTSPCDVLQSKLEWIGNQIRSIRKAPDRGADRRMPCGVYALDHNHILALPRDNGDSRYPYGRDGMNFWVYASGYMHSNEGLFSHFRHAADGREPNIAFFAGLPREDGKGDYTPLPLLPVPDTSNPVGELFQRYTVLSGTAAYFIRTSQDLRFAVRVFVTRGKEVCFTVTAENLGGIEQKLYLSTYFNPFLRHQLFESSEDNWFKQVSVQDDGFGGASGPGGRGFLAKVNEDVSRTQSNSNLGLFRGAVSNGTDSEVTGYEATTARQVFVGGSRSSLHNAASLIHGRFGHDRPICRFIDNAIAGDITHVILKPGARTRLDIVASFTNQQDQVEQLAAEPVRAEGVDRELAEVEADDEQRHKSLRLSVTEDSSNKLRAPVFEGFMEHLKRQVEFCALIRGFVQLTSNSLIGVRDVCQAIEALAAWQDRPARDKLIEVLGFTAPDGRCFRQYSLPTADGQQGKMDLRPFIDQGVWVISCVVSYLKLTGDFGLLDEQVGYHRILDESAGTVKKTREADSVLDHLFKILGYLLEHRDHGQTGCVRAMYGDWNDALDGLGVSTDPDQAYGTGVSVMVTLQVYQNCLEVISLLRVIDPNRHAQMITSLSVDAESIREGLLAHAVVTNEAGDRRIVHGWGDRRSYLVGSFNDPDGVPRDGLTSNAFWVLSGLLDETPDMAGTILDAFDRLDGKYGLKTFAPAFPADIRGVGRIGKLPPGTAENGAAYIHATAFAIMALFRMGEPKRAWDQLIKIFPFTEGHENLSHSPFVMPNSYGHNPEMLIDGQNMNDWQTGSSNVVLKVLIRYVFGFEPTFGGLWIQPAGWAPFKGYSAACTVRGCRVTIESDSVSPRGRKFFVNGKRHKAVYDPKLGIDKLWIDGGLLAEGDLDIRLTD